MIDVDFKIENDEKVEILFNVKNDDDISFSAEMGNIVSKHDKLLGRELPNQHPISAITGLETVLNSKQGVIPDLEVIRSNANKGAMAVQPSTLNDYASKQDLIDGLSTKQPTGDYALKSEIPTKTSELTNDSDYATMEDVNRAIELIPKFKIAVVTSLPAVGEERTIYLVPKDSEEPDVHDEYLWVNNRFELIGTTAIDLSEYAKKSEIPDVSGLATKTYVDDSVAEKTTVVWRVL